MSQASPHISICIPAYKRIEFIGRLLKSIVIQDYKDYEVIVTDDSPDDSVRRLCDEYTSQLPLKYFRNTSTLGTPENWNEGIKRASGAWIKLMHDDDWFEGPGALSRFAKATHDYTDAAFIFSAYTNHHSSTGKKELVNVDGFRFRALRKNPSTLFSRNIVGPPSVTIHRNDGKFYYDKNVKWVVDIDFYIRYLSQTPPFYIDKPLINVGLGEHQVTQDCVRQRVVEIPENFYLLNKVGYDNMFNILVFDAWWRLMRNLEITNTNEIREAGYTGPIPLVIESIIKFQAKFSKPLLKFGPASKALMTIAYLKYKKQIG